MARVGDTAAEGSIGRARLAWAWLLALPRSVHDAAADALEYRRLFVLLPFASIAGLILYAGMPLELPRWSIATMVVVVCSFAWFFRHHDPGRTIGPLAAALLAGFALLPAHGAIFGTTMLVYPAYGHYAFTIDEVISYSDEGQRVVVSGITPLDDETRPVPIRRARLAFDTTEPLLPGDQASANLRLAPVPGPILPGGFDNQFHAYFDGVGAFGSVTSGLTVLERGAGDNWGRLADGLRRQIGDQLATYLEPEAAAIARAMVVGDQSYITEETREVMAASGLAHVYSISGLHLSIVAGGIYFLARLILAALAGALHWVVPVKPLAAVVGIGAAGAYLVLAGGFANIPAFRSTIMVCLVFGAVLAGRRALTMRNVAIAAFIILILDPSSVFRASFQLSFAAVVGLIGVYELPRKPRGEGGGLVRWGLRLVAATAFTSLIAGLATLLFSAYHFQQTAPLSVLANVMVIPVLSLIMFAGVAAVALIPLGLEALPTALLGWGIERMLDIAVLVAGWSAGLEIHPLLTATALLAGLAGLTWFAFVRTQWRFLGPALAAPVILGFGFSSPPDVLIADSTQAVAVADTIGMNLIAGRTGSFAVDVWSETYGVVIGQDHSLVRCDSLGCLVSLPAFDLALATSPAAFAEDCVRNDVVVTRLYAPVTCQTTATVIDAENLRAGGVHWLRWDAVRQVIDIRAAIPDADRPWRLRLDD
jgi:competence protein ComEC